VKSVISTIVVAIAAVIIAYFVLSAVCVTSSGDPGSAVQIGEVAIRLVDTLLSPFGHIDLK
jgi:uncharacterized protein YggT (Ycf19 family)